MTPTGDTACAWERMGGLHSWLSNLPRSLAVVRHLLSQFTLGNTFSNLKMCSDWKTQCSPWRLLETVTSKTKRSCLSCCREHLSFSDVAFRNVII